MKGKVNYNHYVGLINDVIDELYEQIQKITDDKTFKCIIGKHFNNTFEHKKRENNTLIAFPLPLQ